MSYTDPSIRTTGELITASIYNTDIVNNIKALREAAYPVGSIYTSVVSTNPATTLGFGTWTAFGAGRVLVGVDTGQTEFDSVEETGGAKTHTLSVNELPSHSHAQYVSAGGGAATAVQRATDRLLSTTAATAETTGTTGSGAAHNNLQPYITVYFWKRTA